MTISSLVRNAGPFTGTGAIVACPFLFKVFRGQDLVVSLTDSTGALRTLVYGTDYIVSLNANQETSPGGNVTPTTAVPVGSTLMVTSDVPVTQAASLTNQGGFYPRVIEDALDRLTIVQQQVQQLLGQALRFPEIASDGTLPDISMRAGRIQAYDSAGRPALIVGVDSSSAAALDLALQGPAGATRLGWKLAETAATATTVADKLERDVGVSLFDFMTPAQVANCRSRLATMDVTAAVQAAIDTGRTVYVGEGDYLLTDKITLPFRGQLIHGAGNVRSVFRVRSSFNMAATGVFDINTGLDIDDTNEPGPIFSNLGIFFDQPDSPNIGDYIHYPVAIRAITQGRWVLNHVRILRAWNGIDMRGNSGGVRLENIDMFAFNVGVELDGALDSVRITGLQFYNFEATANQVAAFQSGPSIGIKCARCDDLHIHDCLFIGKLGIWFWESPVSSYSVGGAVFGNITNTDFDTNSGILMDAGKYGTISMSACFISTGRANCQGIKLLGGRLRWTSGECQVAAALTNPFIEVAGTDATVGPLLQLGDIAVRMAGDSTLIEVGDTQPGVSASLHIAGLSVLRGNAAWTKPTIRLKAGSRSIMTGIELDDHTMGSNWLAMDVDNRHIISDVSALGWGMSLPAALDFASIQNVTGQPVTLTNNLLLEDAKTKVFSGNLVAGAATVAHGISSAGTRTIRCEAFYKGPSGEMIALTAKVDGTNIILSGGTTTAAYRATITYISGALAW